MRRKSNYFNGIAVIIIVIMWIIQIAEVYALAPSMPSKVTIESVTYNQFSKDVADDNILTVYYDTEEPDFYYKVKSGEFYRASNPESINYKSELLEQGLEVKSIQDLEFVEEYIRRKINFMLNFIVFSIIGAALAKLIVLFRPRKLDTNNSNMSDLSGIFGVGEEGIGVAKDGQKLKGGRAEQDKDKNKAKGFDDIGGLKEVKEDIKCLVDFIVNGEKYRDAGAKLPKGVILYGPSGTGKTLLAKAIANEAKVPFLYSSGSDFIEMYVGVGARRIRELFAEAKRKAPCIVFIDEIDSIGKSRARGGENSEDRKTINALLAEMDGFKEVENILVIGATNRLDDLDSALMRPGRFTDKYCVPIPQTVSERVEILKIHMKNKNFSEDVKVDDLAKETAGFSPAQLEYWMNEAAIIQVQQGMKYINKAILSEAMNKMILQGHIRKDQSERDEKELRLVAWHEAGHAILGLLFGNIVSKVTILSSTSGAGGVTFSVPKKLHLLSIRDMEMQVMELYGGRLAELIYNKGDSKEVTTGASNDIERATEIIHNMVVSYGMTSEFGLLNLERAQTDKEYIVNQEIEISKSLEKRAFDLLEGNIKALEELANRLLEQNTVYADELLELQLEKEEQTA